MHAFLIVPHEHRIIKIRFPEAKGIPVGDVKHMLRYSDFVEEPAFASGDIWCLPEGYKERYWLTSFQVRWGVAIPTFRGRALLVGPYKEGSYTSPQTTEVFLVKTIYYPL